MIKNLILISLTTLIFGQNNRITNIAIAPKKNGVSIQILSDSPIQPSQVAGWYNQSNDWYYITIHNAFGNKASLEKTKVNYPITDIEAIDIGESMQLGFKMSQPVEDFEFYHDNQKLLVALRFPLSSVLASMETDRPVVSLQKSKANSIVINSDYLLEKNIEDKNEIKDKK